MLDGAARIGEVVAAAAADGQPAVGITDHGNMYGVLDFYRAARDAGLTPVIGIEAYWSRRAGSTGRGATSTTSSTSRCSPRSNEGYRNLIKVASHAYLDGYYYKPRVDWELLERTPRGPHRDHRLPRRRGVAAAPRRTTTEARAELVDALPGRSSVATTSSSSSRTTASRRQRRVNPQLLEIARELARAAARHQRQPLHAPRRRRGARRAAVRADRGPRSTTRSGSSSTATSST